MKNYCKRCNKVLEKVYRINITSRNPLKKYQDSERTIIHSDNYSFCRKHYLEVLKGLKKVID